MDLSGGPIIRTESSADLVRPPPPQFCQRDHKIASCSCRVRKGRPIRVGSKWIQTFMTWSYIISEGVSSPAYIAGLQLFWFSFQLEGQLLSGARWWWESYKNGIQTRKNTSSFQNLIWRGRAWIWALLKKKKLLRTFLFLNDSNSKIT